MVNLILDLLAVLLVLPLSLAYVGYGVTRLVLPVSLRRWRLLIAPFVGYAIVVIGFWLLQSRWLNGEWTTVAVLAGATALNAVVLGRCWRAGASHRRGGETVRAAGWGPGQSPAPESPCDAVPRDCVDVSVAARASSWWRTIWGEVAVPASIALVVYLLALIPIVSYGYATAIGTNRDVEQYLAMGDYYRQFAVPTLATAAPNPLREIALKMMSGGYNEGLRGVGYLLAFLLSILNCPALRVFAPTMALLASANVVATYVLARASLGLNRRASSLAALLLGLNGLILWTAFFNYAKQMAVIPLLPMALVAYGVLLRRPSWRSAGFAGLMVAAVALTYWPGTVWLLAAIGVVSVLTAVGRPRLRKVLLVAIGVLVVALVPLARSLEVYGGLMLRVLTRNVAGGTRLSGEWGVDHFLPLEHLYGLAHYVWPRPLSAVERLGPTFGPLAESASSALLVVCAALAAFGVWQALRKRRFMPLAMGLTAVLALAAPLLAQDYYYYFKSVTLSAFAAIGLSTLGLIAAWQQLARWRSIAATVGRVALSLVAVSTLTLAGVNSYFTVGYFTGEPQSSFSRSHLEVARVNDVIAPEATVFLATHPVLQNGPMAVVAYSLMGHPLYGAESTRQYPVWNNMVYLEPGRGGWFTPSAERAKAARQPMLCDYGVFAPDDDPVDKGYAGDLLWGNEAIRVYGRGANLARLEMDAGAGGARVTAAQPLELAVAQPDDAVALPTGCALVFQVATLIEQQMTVEVSEGMGPIPSASHSRGAGQADSPLRDGEERGVSYSLAPGQWRITVAGVPLPARVRVTADGGQALVVGWVHLMSDGETGAERLPDRVLVSAQCKKQESELVAQLQWLGPQPTKVPGWLQLRVRDLDTDQVGPPVGNWPLESAVAKAGARLNLSDGTIELERDGERSEVIRWSPEGGEGRYAAELGVVMASDFHDRDAYKRVSELFRFTMRGSDKVPVDAKAVQYAHRYLPVESWRPVNATFGESLHLWGCTMERQTLEPGGTAKLRLFWQVPKSVARDWRVLLQLTDGEGQTQGQRDESLKSALSYPVEGDDVEVLRSDYDVTIDQRASIGEYAVRFQVYSPVTMHPLPAGDGVEVVLPGVFRVED